MSGKEVLVSLWVSRPAGAKAGKVTNRGVADSFASCSQVLRQTKPGALGHVEAIGWESTMSWCLCGHQRLFQGKDRRWVVVLGVFADAREAFPKARQTPN